MTIKEELLNYIEDNVTDSAYLKVHEIVLDTGEGSSLHTYQKGTKLLTIPKARTLTIISDFSDELVGQYPNDTNTIQILSWELA